MIQLCSLQSIIDFAIYSFLFENMLHFKYIVPFCVYYLVSKVVCQSNYFRDDYQYLEELSSFYKIHTIHRTWEEAKERCELEGATLFYPETQNEVEIVLRYWNKTQPFNYIFIGISDLVAKEVYITVDGVLLKHVYSRWAPGEPNNSGGDEDCLVLTHDGLLNDDRCSKKIPFICKKTSASINWNDQCFVPDYEYNYSEENGRCYKFHTMPRNWMEAALVCDIEQSYIAVINSEAEAQHLVNLTKEAINKHKININVCNSVALGFNNKDNNKGWNTVLGEKLDDSGYNQWDGSQPDGEGMEQCGSMNYNGLLNDINCDKKCYFICEHEVQQLSILDDRFSG